MNGGVRLRGAELRLRDPAVSLSNVNGLVALGPATIDVTGLEGDLNGGRVAIIGGFSYEGLAVTSGSLSMQATGVALDMPRGLRTEIDGSLALSMGTRLGLQARAQRERQRAVDLRPQAARHVERDAGGLQRERTAGDGQALVGQAADDRDAPAVQVAFEARRRRWCPGAAPRGRSR